MPITSLKIHVLETPMKNKILGFVLLTMALTFSGLSVAHGHHEYHHYGYAPAHGYYNYGDRWLGIGIVGAVVAGALIQSQQPYKPPVVYTTPYEGGYSTPYDYHWEQIPMMCYAKGVNVQPYICGYRHELVPN